MNPIGSFFTLSGILITDVSYWLLNFLNLVLMIGDMISSSELLKERERDTFEILSRFTDETVSLSYFFEADVLLNISNY